MKKRAYINGLFVDGEESFEIISPLTLLPAGSVPALKSDDIDLAFSAARRAFNGWRDLSRTDRESYLVAFLEELKASKQELALVMNKEIGKPVKEAEVEIIRTVEYIEKTIKSWKDVEYKDDIINNKVSHQTRVPMGVVLAISPFNYPVNLSLAKIAPALITGNTVVFKAATNGSLTGAFIAELFDKVNIPAGVFNYVTGRGRDIGDFLTASSQVDMISFTGGVRVGKDIARKSSMIPLVLELGGNDAAYVREDADLEKAASEIVAGAFGFSGQRCTAIKRVIAHDKIADDLFELIVNKSRGIEIVPLVTEAAAKYVKDLFDESQRIGAKVLLGGEWDRNRAPATIVETTSECRSWNEEAFGPLLPLVRVSTDKEGIDMMNKSEFGLQNSIFTKDVEWALKIGSKIESGTLNINAKSSRGPDEFPFSGIKDSGFGTQGIIPALESMTRIINIVENK